MRANPMSRSNAVQTESASPFGAFSACGKVYESERDAIVSLIDRFRVEETAGGTLFGAWADLCKIPELRGGLQVIAERESYHGRMFARRLQELGVECRATLNDPSGSDLGTCLVDPAVRDEEKLARFNSFIGDAEATTRPIREFGEAITEDRETKATIKLFAEDEFSTIRWLRQMGDQLGV
jgi:hypothetical protein